MLEIIGKYANVKVMIDEVDSATLSQIYTISSSPVAENTNIVIMPDTHAGAGCVIGFTQKLDNNNPRIVPNLLGVDISCTISSYNLGHIKNIDFEDFDKFIRANIPLGAGSYLANRNKKLDNKYLTKDVCRLFEETNNLIKEDGCEGYSMKVSIYNQLLSIGSGNHFIELGKDEQDNYWLSVHCGSRNLGLTVCNIYMKHADQYRLDHKIKTERDLSYLEKDSIYYDRYINCVRGCQLFAEINHKMIADTIISNYFNQHLENIEDKIITKHNYLDIDNMIIRKGAISAYKDQMVVIPFNMRDGIAICKGKGNIDWNESAPHGAGRIMSRGEAKRELNLDNVKQDMKNHGVFTTSLDYALDEAPGAYKDTELIKQCIKPTVDIVHMIKPLYNVKGK